MASRVSPTHPQRPPDRTSRHQRVDGVRSIHRTAPGRARTAPRRVTSERPSPARRVRMGSKSARNHPPSFQKTPVGTSTPSPQSGTPRTARRTGLEPQAAWRRHVKRRRRRGPASVAAVRSASDAVESTASPPLRHRRDTCGAAPSFVCCCIGCSAVNKSGLSLALASIRDPAIIAASLCDRCGHYTATVDCVQGGSRNPNEKRGLFSPVQA